MRNKQWHHNNAMTRALETFTCTLLGTLQTVAILDNHY